MPSTLKVAPLLSTIVCCGLRESTNMARYSLLRERRELESFSITPGDISETAANFNAGN
jgi:hypothetical protein